MSIAISKRVVWAADREHGIDWEEDVEPVEAHLVDAAEQSLSARAQGDALPTPPRLPTAAVVAVATLDGDPVFGGARCAVVRVATAEGRAAFEGLSKREREIARLLVSGYSGVNVAAISGLSENTVRTYVRRLYGKLGVEQPRGPRPQARLARVVDADGPRRRRSPRRPTRRSSTATTRWTDPGRGEPRAPLELPMRDRRKFEDGP